MLLSLSLFFSLLTATCGSFAFLNGRVFSVLGHRFECHKWSFVLYIVSFSALKMPFSKLSLAKYRCMHKKTIHISCLQLLQNVFTNLSPLQLLHKSFSSGFTRNDLYKTICMTHVVNLFIQIWKDRTHPILPLVEILRNSSKPFSEAATGGIPQKVFFKYFKIFTGKHLYWGLFLNKVAGHQSYNFIKTLIKKRLQNRYFLWLSGNLQ